MQEKEYARRINRTIDYIEKHIDKQFSLAELADIAHFSRFHFHRIFQAFVGETPFQFILRVRLEKAASMLLSNPNDGIAVIAEKCGFQAVSVFSRSFRGYFGMPASQWRSQQPNSNQSQQESNEEQHGGKPVMYICDITKTIKWKAMKNPNVHVEVRELPKMSVVYLRHTGPYKGDGKLFERLFGKLYAWAGPRGLLQHADSKTLVVYHDDPNITEESKQRISACLLAPAETRVDGEVGKMDIEPGKYMVARFVLGVDEFGEAWDWVFGQWFPVSGYQPADTPCFEMYEKPMAEGKCTVDICVPVKPL